MEGRGLKISARKQAQTMNAIIEGIYIMEANILINLMRGQRSNYTGVLEFLATENGFSNM